MTLQEARDLATTLAPKSPGHLITAQDWNALVSVLVEYGNGLITLPARLAAAEAALEALDGRVTALEVLPDLVQAIDDETKPLRDNYALSVRTTQENFVVGQVAELVFRATKLDGTPITGPRPWLDVVTTWGRLRAAPGFVVRENAEENAISVQFNAAGEVRVQLRSQFTRGFTPLVESNFGNALRAASGVAGKTIGQVFETAVSPQDAEAKVAFKAMHASYNGNQSIKAYADGYLQQATGGRVSAIGNVGSIGGVVSLGDWDVYRATVMAFAKPDASATTPDPTRGVATVQVSFREWIPHWGGDYVLDLDLATPNWSQFFDANKGRADLLPFAVTELDKRAKVDGVLGHVRNMKAFDRAAGLINPGNDSNLAQNRVLLKGAVQMQLAAGGADTQAAFSYAEQAQATGQVGQTARSAAQMAQDAAGAKQAVTLLETRVKAAEQVGKDIGLGIKALSEDVTRINPLEVANLGGRLNNIHLSLDALSDRLPR